MPRNRFHSITKKLLVFINVLLALLFLIGAYGGNFNAKTWWPFNFLTLVAPYFLLLLLFFIAFWAFVKARLLFISVIAIVASYGPLQQIIPFRFSSFFKKEKTNSAVRVMSWNVEHFDILEHKTHPEKKQHMLDLINEYNPDVACFQEMVGSDSFSNAINYIPDLLQKLAFKGYNYSYNRKLDFDSKHHFGIITFSKLPIVNKKTVSFYPNDYNSTFQYTDFLNGSDTIRVFNIHLQSLKFSTDNLKYIDDPEIKDGVDLKKSRSIVGKLKRGFLKRKIQSERIQDETDKSPFPVIVCGDFNDVPNSYAYNTIGNGLKNAFAEKGSGLGRTYSGISPTLRIDNIFASEKFEVLQYKCVNKKLSDHFPVITDVEIKK